jgi:flagellar hook-length control protein FliK
MIAKLLAFNNLFAAKGNLGTLPSNPAQPQHNKHLTLDQLEQIPLTDISKPIKSRKSYNELIDAQNEAQTVPSQELTDIVVKEIAPQIPQADCQLLTTSDEPRAANHPALAQLLMAAELAGKAQDTSQVLVQSDVTRETILPENNLPKSDAGQESALVNNNLPKLTMGIPDSNLPKSDTSQGQKTTLFNNNLLKSALGFPNSKLMKSAMDVPNSKLLRTSVDQGQVGQQVYSPQVVVETTATKAPTQVADCRPMVADNQQLITSDGPRATSNEPRATNIDTADKPSVLSNEKILIPENNISDIEQNVSAEPKKPLFNTEKPIDNKISGQYRGPSQNGFAESANGGQEQGGNLSDWLPGQKSSQTQVKVSIEQITDQNGSSNNGPQPNFEQMLVADNAQTAVKEQLPAAKTAKNAQSLPNTSVSEQIQGSIQGSLRQGDQQITIRLNPPELGKITIKFHEQQDQLTGLLQVSKTQTKYEVQQALPEIIQNLQNMGIHVKKLEVVMSEPNLTGQQAYNNQLLQDGSAGHQAGTRENTPGGTTAANEWLTKDSGYSQTLQSQQDTQITDKSINMLM